MSENAQDISEVAPAEQAVVAMIHPQAVDFFVNVLGPDDRFAAMTQSDSILFGDRLLGLYWDDVTGKLEELDEGRNRAEQDRTMQRLLGTCAQQSRYYYAGHSLDSLAKFCYPESSATVGHSLVGRNIRTTAEGIHRLNEGKYDGDILQTVIEAWSEEQADSLPAVFRENYQPEVSTESEPTTKPNATTKPTTVKAHNIDSPFINQSAVNGRAGSRMGHIGANSQLDDKARALIVSEANKAAKTAKLLTGFDPYGEEVRRGIAHPDEFDATEGNCRDDPDAMYVEGTAQNIAKLICVGCAVRGACLGTALARKEDGVWGGLTKRERAALLKVKPNFVAESLL